MKKATKDDMRSSWLVQRLEKPHRVTFAGVTTDSPFSFGGGLRNGGLSSEAMELLRGVFSFDYMGAAEFEWGAVPEALKRMAAESLEAWSFSFPLTEVAPNWRDKDALTPDGDATIYVVSRPEWRSEIKARVRLWSSEGYGSRLKEQTHLCSVLRPSANDEFPSRVCGWLELDNGFFFFTDKAMWEATARLFGVEVAS